MSQYNCQIPKMQKWILPQMVLSPSLPVLVLLTTSMNSN
ncbi:hypothetical protein Ahy_B06g080538 isoform C [Arachis hypogaea]|uniref:Uncharacterized protein n=1 Tax=Arachis hypogaea TaxID=3818 RepID=A0A444YIE3_ARAHY|nr:hypothetical protein Ahy_B06g080538 isoform C [Arachis hypogaea]